MSARVWQELAADTYADARWFYDHGDHALAIDRQRKGAERSANERAARLGTTRYQVTCIDRHGDRIMLGPNQGRRHHLTREDAEQALAAMLANNSEERLASVYGPQALGTFRVDPFECYAHGDAIGIYPRGD